jgi:predicted  nucleic acid-binding Zn-ribbon protein
MTDAKEVKAGLQRELEMLAKARDELKLQIQLAKADARDEWKKLESTWLGIEAEIKRIGEQSREPVKDMATAARALMEELRRGYERIKTQLKEARASNTSEKARAQKSPDTQRSATAQAHPRGPSA